MIEYLSITISYLIWSLKNDEQYIIFTDLLPIISFLVYQDTFYYKNII